MTASLYPYFDQRFIALAHRGGSLLPANRGIENTLRAFQNAVDLGYTHLETDVHVSADGVLFAFHDEELDRATDGAGLLAEHTAAELRELRVGGREPIPTLAELLTAFPDAYFNIDIKADDAVLPLAEIIQECGAADRVCVASFKHRRLARFRAVTANAIATSASPLEVAYTAYTILPRLRAVPCQAFQIPLRDSVGSVQFRTLTPALVRHARAAGQHVHIWTIDDPRQMEQLIDYGVDGIVTDRPDLLKEVLIAKDMWEGN